MNKDYDRNLVIEERTQIVAEKVTEFLKKHHRTIMDFRKVTDLFADPAFDGEPVRVKEFGQDDELETPDEEAQDDTPVLDDETGEELQFDRTANILFADEYPTIIDGGDISAEAHGKYYVNGVDVSVLHECVQYIDKQDKLIVPQT